MSTGLIKHLMHLVLRALAEPHQVNPHITYLNKEVSEKNLMSSEVGLAKEDIGFILSLNVREAVERNGN